MSEVITDAQIREAIADDGLIYVEATGKDDEVKFELFEYTIPGHAPMKWNVTLARYLLREPHARVMRTPLTPDLMREFLQHVEINPAQVAKADTSRPGIAAPYVLDGATCYMVIDGAHRIAKALQHNVTFYVDILTDRAAKRCYQGPPSLVPWGSSPTLVSKTATPAPQPQQQYVQRPPREEGW